MFNNIFNNNTTTNNNNINDDNIIRIQLINFIEIKKNFNK